jgi:PAS domain S-box-containing protein
VIEMLRESGSPVFKTAQAGRLSVALEALANGVFHVVLLDLDLPDSSGLEGLEKIATANPALPVIVLTGRNDEGVGMQALQKRAGDYLVKDQINTQLLTRSIKYAIERKRSEESLSQSEERYHTLFSTMLEGFCIIEVVFDPQERPVDYRFLEVNDAFEKQTGLHEAQGKLMRDLAPEHETHWFEIYGKVALTGEPARFVNEAKALNRWFDVSAFRLGGPESRKVAILFSDVSESKNKEAELYKVNRVLKARNKSDQAMLHAENEQDYLQKICGIIAEDCGHSFVWIGFAEQDETRSVRPVAQAGFEAGYLKELKLTWADTERGRGPTGTAIRTGKPSGCKNMQTDQTFAPWRAEAVKRGYASSLVLPLMTEGQAFGALTIYSKKPGNFSEEETVLLAGLTDDLAYGIRTLRLRAAHKLSEEDVQKIAHIGVWEFDLKANLMIWSNEVYRIFEVDPERFISSYKAFLNVVHPEDRKMVDKAYNDCVSNRTPYDSAYRLLMPDGRVKYVRERCEAFYGADGRPLRSVGILHDITDQKRSEEGLMAARTELERAKRLSDIGTLAATVAHELRNPLATIGMAAVNIKRKAKNPDLDRHLANIDKKIFESNQIINNLLFYSRLKPPHYERVGIHDILEESIEAAGERFAGNICLDRNISGLREVFVEADPIQLKEVLNNILNNAADAIHDGGGKIEVSGARENGFVRIAVKDSGMGIDKDTLERVFDPFFTTKAKGTGLGLSVCRQIMAFHGGSIELRSVPGGGTAANMLLPVKRQAAPAAQLQTEKP